MTTLVDALRERSETNTTGGFLFLEGGQEEGARFSLAELDARARAIGATLRARGLEGKRLLLLYGHGLEFVEALFGTLYAGAVAVPAYPPDPSRLGRTLPRLTAVIRDAGADFALTTSALADVAASMGSLAPELERMQWIATDAIPSAAADEWRRPAIDKTSPAIIQYTSGSTGTPRGIALSHRNIIHQLDATGSELVPGGAMVSWVPFYHDMGLIGMMWAAYAGGRNIILSPLDFLARPSSWLAAISRYRTPVTNAPNFALDLCVRRVTDAEREGWDLSCLERLVIAAEPISPATINAFADRFAAQGLRRTALTPGFGLAECTLATTLAPRERGPIIMDVDPVALGGGHAVRATGDRSMALVGSGQALPGMEVIVVNPETAALLPSGDVGEVWLRGDSVAPGYWMRPEETAAVFGVKSADGRGPWLRTGDLGFLAEGELFVTGRRKDVIIVRARNIYPQDLERTAEQAHQALRRGCAAAFSLPGRGTERVGLVIEVSPERAGSEQSAIFDAIRTSVAAEHDVSVDVIALIAPRSIPKTSSGKIQRRGSREALLAGELELIAESKLEESTAPESTEPDALRRIVAEVLGVNAAALQMNQALTAMGLDSLKSVRLAEQLQSAFGVEIQPATLLAGATLADIAPKTRAALPKDVLPPIAVVPRSGEGPLSFTEGALFRWVELEPGSPSHNLFMALQIDGALDMALLDRSFQDLISRQESLRTRFVRVGDRALRQVQAAAPWSFTRVDLSTLLEADRNEALRRRALEVHRRPIDAAQPPLMYAELVRLDSSKSVLLLLISHLISDGWSLGIFLRELGAFYGARLRQTTPQLPALPIQCLDFATWEQGVLDPATLGAELEKARQGLVPLSFPLDRPMPDKLDRHGACFDFTLGRELRARLGKLCAREALPLSTVFTTAFQVVLHERTKQDTISFNLIHSDRQRLGLQQVIGFFAYALIHQEDVGAHRQQLKALMHLNQDRINRTEYRDRLRMVLRTTSNRVALNFHSYASALDAGGLAVSLRQDLVQAYHLWDAHDLMLDLRDTSDDVGASIFYRPAVLDGSTIQAVAASFLSALRELCDGG